MRRAAAVLAALALAVLAAACGETTEIREPDLVVSSSTPAPARGEPAEPQDGRTRIAVVTHGQASSAFWSTVRNGVETAGREAGVSVSYRSPDSFSVERMRRLINDAVDRRPGGLVVSIPSPEVLPAIRRAVLAGIPVVSINSGSEVFRRLGVLAHVGQPEEEAGYQAGVRMRRAGVRQALCVNQEPGNRGLDLRCRGFARALAEAGGRSRMIGVDTDAVAQATRRVRATIDARRTDGILSLGSRPADIAVRAARDRDDIRIATFDLSSEVLEKLRDGRLDFAVDQQPYLQGYLPVLFLGQFARYGLFPAQNQVIPTGPNFVTRETADKAMLLSRQGIR